MEEEIKPIQKKVSSPALDEIKRFTQNSSIFYKEYLEKYDLFLDKLESLMWLARLVVVALFILILIQFVKIN